MRTCNGGDKDQREENEGLQRLGHRYRARPGIPLELGGWFSNDIRSEKRTRIKIELLPSLRQSYAHFLREKRGGLLLIKAPLG